MTGVYLITNTITGAKYVGQSIDIKRRIMEHRAPNAGLKSKSKKFVEDIRKYGIDSFSFDVLEECPAEQLLANERKWIATLKPEYNTIGLATNAETRRKISKTLKRHWQNMPEEAKRRIIDHNLIGPHKGHEVSSSTRQKLREANLGKRTYAVKVVETGIVYRGAQECAAALGCSYYSVLNQLVGKTKTTKGYHLERVETIRDECSGVGQRRELVEVQGDSKEPKR